MCFEINMKESAVGCSPDSPTRQAKLEPMLGEKAGNGVQLRALDGLWT